jgi:competence protein ComEA
VKKGLLYIAFGVVCGLLVGGIVLLASRPPRGHGILLSPPPTPRLWVVQVSGAIVNPGVYELPAGSRVRDLVQAAGGLTAEANTAAINLAALLEDGQNIVIQASASSASPPAQRSKPLLVTVEPAATRLININTAALEELDELPDIGPVIAQRIIDYRTANGLFMAIEEIVKVQGIGQVTFEKIKDLITIEP